MSPFFDLPIIFIVLTLHMICAPVVFKLLSRIGMVGGNNDIEGMLIAFFGLAGFIVFVAYGIAVGVFFITITIPFPTMLQVSYSTFYQSFFKKLYDSAPFLVSSAVIIVFSSFIYWMWVVQSFSNLFA